MRAKKTLESETVRWSRMISLIGLVGLLLLAMITVCEALSRWLLGIPIPGVSDVSSLVVALAVTACLPLVFAQRGNITVRFIIDALGPRGKAILEIFGTLVSLFIFCLLTWQLWVYANELADRKATTLIIVWPTAPWWYVATFLMGLCVPVLLILIFLDIRSGFTNHAVSNKDTEDDGKAGEK